MNNALQLSVLDLATVKENRSIKQTFNEILESAQHVEDLGFTRFWLAEHHNMASIASSATSVLIGYVAGGTNKIKVGSGGVMLPNHSSLVIAEQFGTLESLYPGRIDLGIGRAPGTDGLTAHALGRDPRSINEKFPRQIFELQNYFSKDNSTSSVRAIPGEGLDIPIYILGSSTDSAYLAAELGLPYAFAGHFAPEMMREAFYIYRENFEPSDYLAEPYIIACANGIAADTNEEANMLATTLYQAFLNIIRNDRKPFPAPTQDMDEIWNPMEKAGILQKLKYSFIGNAETVEHQIKEFQDTFHVDELMINSHIHNQEAKLKSYGILKAAVNNLNHEFVI